MDLLKVVQTDSLEKVKEFITSNGISADSKWMDYTILNRALECGRIDIANFLISKGCRVSKTSNYIAANTPLHYAVKLGNTELLTKLLLRNASIVAANTEGDTPLHLAFLNKNDNMVDIMLSHVKHTKSLNAQNIIGLTYMHIACVRNNTKAVQSYIDDGVDVNISINSNSPVWAGYTPLHFAIENQCLEVIKILVTARADRYAKNSNNLMPIQIAKQTLKKLLIIDYLVSGDDVLIENYNKLSNFHVACMRDDPKIVESFVENGVSINNPISKSSVFCPSYAPLHFAVESNCKENVQILLKHGAHIEQQNEYYMTALHVALYNEDHNAKDTIVDLLYSSIENKDINRTDLNGLNYFHVACTRNDIKTSKKFLNSGENVNNQILYNLKNFSHYTPLHFAVRYSCKEVVELLIKYGANVNRSDNGMHGTPLHLAFDNGCIEIIEILLKNGARANAIRPFDDKTMLHLFVKQAMNKSIKNNNMETIHSICKIEENFKTYIQKLVYLGCNVNAKDSDGNTALHLACSKLEHGVDLVVHLLENGADINIENNEGKTPFDKSFSDIYRMNAESYMILYDHVQKLKALGMSINSKNKKCCTKLLSEKNECNSSATCFTKKDMDRRRRQRLDEIAKMKLVKIDRDITLYKVLFESSKRLGSLSQKSTLKNIVKSKNFKKEYPLYGYLIQLQFQKGLDNIGVIDFEQTRVEIDGKARLKRQRVI